MGLGVFLKCQNRDRRSIGQSDHFHFEISRDSKFYFVLHWVNYFIKLVSKFSSNFLIIAL